ncbi:hypothetical protein [Streptomyces sp. NBC_00696]|uniref:hypothetical protein n=1 Tax=Streptomyces sp. NBC_00696 TaxID=2903672 RepID=UPI002E30B853|nr:hypothetical protein [Streptomyces sp. NBC_00696]
MNPGRTVPSARGCRRAFFAGGLEAEQGEQETRFEPRATGELYTASAPVTVTYAW